MRTNWILVSVCLLIQNVKSMSDGESSDGTSEDTMHCNAHVQHHPSCVWQRHTTPNTLLHYLDKQIKGL
jgi:hypothetical protein